MLMGQKIEVPEEALKHTMIDGSKPSTMHAAQLTLQYLASKAREGMQDFSLINNAEICPEICNEFVTIFIEQHKYQIDRGDAIDLTRNFSYWLYKNGHTCTKISMT